MLFRSVVAGLVAAMFVLFAMKHDHVVVKREVVYVDRPTTPAQTTVDVSAAVAPDSLVDLVTLAPSEYIAMVDDHVMSSPAAARAAIAGHAGSYVDLAINSETSPAQRRVVLLLH